MGDIAGFMQHLFHARLSEEKRIQESRTEYRRKFFHPECLWDSRRFNLEMIQSEQILDIEGTELRPIVITEYRASVSVPSAQIERRRYLLETWDASFRIRAVERQCPYCRGKGGPDCIGCKGKHWL